MIVACLSDLHFGDPLSLLVRRDDATQAWKCRPYAKRLLDTLEAKRVDYLVLLGDVFDFSIESYEQAFAAGRVFLNELAARKQAGSLPLKTILYVPGNHDFSLWHTVEHEVNIVMPLRTPGGSGPSGFRWSVPAILDDRAGQEPMVMPTVGRNAAGGYGGLFLDGLAEGLSFVCAYPNLYLVDQSGASTVFTHGHYFQPAWAVLGEVVPALLKRSDRDRLLPTEAGSTAYDLRAFIAMNHPTNLLLSSGLGMAGPATYLVRTIQRLWKDTGEEGAAGTGSLAHPTASMRELRDYLERARTVADAMLHEKGLLEWLTDLGLDKLVTFTMEKAVGKRCAPPKPGARHTVTDDVKKRIGAYLAMTDREVKRLEQPDSPGTKTAVSLPLPTRLIFGDTHDPIPLATPFSITLDGRTVEAANTGSFLAYHDAKGKEAFAGAEIMMYESGVGWSSQHMGEEP